MKEKSPLGNPRLGWDDNIYTNLRRYPQERDPEAGFRKHTGEPSSSMITVNFLTSVSFSRKNRQHVWPIYVVP
jgi:hypothetical protein